MVSRRKRSSYVTESDTSSDGDFDYYSSQDAKRLNRNPIYVNSSKVKPEYEDTDGDKRMKNINRNALMARENRRRKKLYMENLENEVKKLRTDKKNLNSIVNNQSCIISGLQKEIKYLKSVLANSSDISNLIRNIQCNTGMSVTTSLDKTLTLNNSCVSKPKQYLARKTAYPWEDIATKDACNMPDANTNNLFSNASPTSSDSTNNFDISSIFQDLDCELDNLELPDFQLNFENEDQYLSNEILNTAEDQFNKTHFVENEHNYTNISKSESENDVGVCLHVSKHRVSLEFCTSCCENATGAWKNVN